MEEYALGIVFIDFVDAGVLHSMVCNRGCGWYLVLLMLWSS